MADLRVVEDAEFMFGNFVPTLSQASGCVSVTVRARAVGLISSSFTVIYNVLRK